MRSFSLPYMPVQDNNHAKKELNAFKAIFAKFQAVVDRQMSTNNANIPSDLKRLFRASAM